MTWTCPKCGRIFVTEDQYNKHSCNPWQDKYKRACTTCGGTGLVTSLFGPTMKCKTCNGTGRI